VEARWGPPLAVGGPVRPSLSVVDPQEDGFGVSYEGTGARRVRATALGRGTHGVSDVGRLVADQFHVAFPHRIWVAGQVRGVRGNDEGLSFRVRSATGEEPFSLLCEVQAESLPAVRDLLSRDHDADVEDVVRDGRLARLGGLLRFDPGLGAPLFTVSEIDPSPTVAQVDESRTEALRVVAEAGLAEPQRSRSTGVAPVVVAVVGDARDGAVERAVHLLEQSSFPVRVRPTAVDVTRADAGSALASSITASGRDTDVVLLVRGEGRQLGLGSYDELQVARAVAEVQVPVVCGLGGRGVHTASDEVACATVPTAEAAVEWVLSRLGRARALLDELAGDVETAVTAADARFRQALEQAKQEADDAGRVAVARTERSRARRTKLLWAACLLLTVLIVGLAVVTATPWVAAALALPALLLGGAPLARRYDATRGVARMSQANEDFTQVLDRLRTVRDELATTANPERVGVLREIADQLVVEGRELLGRATGLSGPERPLADEPDAAPPVAQEAGPESQEAEPASIDLDGASERAGQL
jgi:hypothetical protein